MSHNSITGDAIRTRPQSKEFEDGWERIFGGKDKKVELEKPMAIDIIGLVEERGHLFGELTEMRMRNESLRLKLSEQEKLAKQLYEALKTVYDFDYEFDPVYAYENMQVVYHEAIASYEERNGK